MNEILAQPNPLELATGVEGLLEVGGQAFIEGLPQGLQAGWFITDPALTINGSTITKASGGNTYSTMIGTRRFPVEQPLEIYGAFNEVAGQDFSILIGLRDNFGQNSVFEVYQYAPETQFRYHVYHQNVRQDDPYIVTGNDEGFRLNVEGNYLVYYHHSAGQMHEILRRPIAEGVLDYRFYYAIYFAGDKIIGAFGRASDVTIPLNTSNIQTRFASTIDSSIAIRAVDNTHFGLTAETILNDVLVLSHEKLATPVNVPITITPLYIRPTDRPCGSYVIENEIIQFESNGGLGGIFQATGGTILNGLQWQAPSSTGTVEFTYQIGNVIATCMLQVVPTLEVDGVQSDGHYPDLAQGETVQFVATCPDAVFSLEYPIPEVEPEGTDTPSLFTILTREGRLVAPTDAQDAVFGAKDLVVKVRGCNQTYRFRVHIQAMYPTPKFCGPTPIHWQPPLIPDYLPNTSTMTGGTSQVKNRNAEGILMWDVTYDNMLQSPPTNCTCVMADVYHKATCSASLAIAERLDNFYKQVTKVKYFTVLDYQTEIMYKYVRLTAYDGNHSLYQSEQSRQLQMKQEGNLLFE